MSLRSTTVAAVGLSLFTAACVLSGCGGSNGGAKAATRTDDCETALLAKAEAKVLERDFDAGRLGTARQVRAQSSPEHPFFLPNGKMVAYARMTNWQRASFNDWAASPAVDRVAHDELEAADREAAALAKTECG